MEQRPDSAGRRAWLVGLLFLVVVGPWVKHLTAQPAARLALTAAVAEHAAIGIDDYEGILGVDRIVRDGHLYSDKAPGQPVLAVPFFLLERAAGADPAEVPRGEGNLTLWWITFWSSAVPGALLVVLVAHLCRAATSPVGTLATIAVAFGTLIMPFSAELYGHVLATALGVAAWALVRGERTAARMVLAGATAGLAVVVEYQMVLFVAIVAVFLVVRGGWRSAGRFAVGGAPFVALLLAYQAAAFGSPLRTSYSEKSVHADGGAAIVGVPDPEQALEVLFGSRGLLLFAPVTAIGLLGLYRLARGERGSARDDAIVGLAVFVAYLALQAGWPNPWGGEMPGPRYMIPALPLLAPGIAIAWRPRGASEWVALGWSVAMMTLPLITLHLVPAGGVTGLQHLENLENFGIAPTIWTMAFGGAGWLVYAATIVGAAALLRRDLRARRSLASAGDSPSPTRSSLAPP